MMRNLTVKVCGIKDATNCEQIAALCPDYLGFIFVESSPRFVGTTLSREFLARLNPSIRKIGVFADTPINDVCRIVTSLGLDGVQLHGAVEITAIKQLRSLLPHLEIRRSISIRSAFDISEIASFDKVVDGYVLDGANPGSGERFDWRVLHSYPSSRPFLLAGGVGIDSIQEIRDLSLEIPLLEGIDINSKVELAPGVKDVELVRKVLDEVRV